MTITLPDEWRERLEASAKLNGFTTVDEYVAEVLSAEWSPDDGEFPCVPIPEELRIKSREDLEAKILEGMNSGPPILVTPQFWANLRQRAREGPNGNTDRAPKS